MSKGYWLNNRGFYKIDKCYLGQRISGTTCYGKGQELEVEAEIRERMNELYEALHRGKRPKVLFRDCAVEYCVRNQGQAQIKHFEGMLGRLDPYVGELFADEIYYEHPMVTKLINDLLKKGRKNCTVNSYLEAISRVLTAATTWRHDWCNLTWLGHAPKIPRLPNDYRPPKPLSWDNQAILFSEMREHMKGVATVFVNTGLRDDELNTMEWENELELPGGIMAFIVNAKGSRTQPIRKRLVIFNSVAKAEIDRRRGDHPERVFTYKGKPTAKTTNTSFQKARQRSGIDVRVQDLRHTFGHRLREAAVDEETRAELLGHGKSLTTHYSAASIQILYEAVERITVRNENLVVVNLEEYRKIA